MAHPDWHLAIANADGHLTSRSSSGYGVCIGGCHTTVAFETTRSLHVHAWHPLVMMQKNSETEFKEWNHSAMHDVCTVRRSSQNNGAHQLKDSKQRRPCAGATSRLFLDGKPSGKVRAARCLEVIWKSDCASCIPLNMHTPQWWNST